MSGRGEGRPAAAVTSGDAGFVLDVRRETEGRIAITLEGRIDFGNVDALRQRLLEEAAALPRGGECALRPGAIQSGDSAAAALWLLFRHDLEQRGLKLTLGPLDRTSQALLDLVRPERLERRSALPHRHPHILQTLGDYVLGGAGATAEVLQFIGRVALSLSGSLRHPRRVRWREVAYLVQTTGAEALPIVALMSLLIGLVTGFSSSLELRQFGADIYIADLIGFGMTREMGPILAAVLLAGRSASSFAAEIGTMRISDEVDALSVMGIRPLEYLVIPRILAAMIALPLLTLFADACGILGGMILALANLGLSPRIFLQELRTAVGPWDVFSGVLKALVFGMLIAGVGCHRGLETRGGALGVGRSTTGAVVMSIFLVVLADSVFVIVFHYLGLG